MSMRNSPLTDALTRMESVLRKPAVIAAIANHLNCDYVPRKPYQSDSGQTTAAYPTGTTFNAVNDAGAEITPSQLESPIKQASLTSRSLQSICKDMNFVIRFGRIGYGGGNHGCEGHFGKEVCCAAER
jgi:hypothetical protein